LLKETTGAFDGASTLRVRRATYCATTPFKLDDISFETYLLCINS